MLHAFFEREAFLCFNDDYCRVRRGFRVVRVVPVRKECSVYSVSRVYPECRVGKVFPVYPVFPVWKEQPASALGVVLASAARDDVRNADYCRKSSERSP